MDGASLNVGCEIVHVGGTGYLDRCARNIFESFAAEYPEE